MSLAVIFAACTKVSSHPVPPSLFPLRFLPLEKTGTLPTPVLPQLLRQFASNWKGMSNDQPAPKEFISSSYQQSKANTCMLNRLIGTAFGTIKVGRSKTLLESGAGSQNL